MKTVICEARTDRRDPGRVQEVLVLELLVQHARVLEQLELGTDLRKLAAARERALQHGLRHGSSRRCRRRRLRRRVILSGLREIASRLLHRAARQQRLGGHAGLRAPLHHHQGRHGTLLSRRAALRAQTTAASSGRFLIAWLVGSRQATGRPPRCYRQQMTVATLAHAYHRGIVESNVHQRSARGATRCARSSRAVVANIPVGSRTRLVDALRGSTASAGVARRRAIRPAA